MYSCDFGMDVSFYPWKGYMLSYKMRKTKIYAEIYISFVISHTYWNHLDYFSCEWNEQKM